MTQYVLSCFVEFIEQAKCSAAVSTALNRLCALYGIHQMNNKTRDFLKVVLKHFYRDQVFARTLTIMCRVQIYPARKMLFAFKEEKHSRRNSTRRFGNKHSAVIISSISRAALLFCTAYTADDDSCIYLVETSSL